MKLRSLCVIALLSLGSISSSLYAQPIDKMPPKRGEYQFSFLLLDIYDATLYMPSDCDYPNCSFSLKLKYNRDFKGSDIAKRSLEEMKQQKEIPSEIYQSWLKKLNSIFRDVNQNDIIIGSWNGSSASFYFNDTFIGTIDDKILAQRFFDIWLSPKTSEPKMRKALLGF